MLEYCLLATDGQLTIVFPAFAVSSQYTWQPRASDVQDDQTDLPPKGSRIEDTLADYVPPKRYVKPEETRSINAPGLFIAVSTHYVLLFQHDLLTLCAIWSNF